MNNLANIVTSEHANVIACYWQMMHECERFAQARRDIVLKHWVEDAYRLWHRITGQELFARWSTAPTPSGLPQQPQQPQQMGKIVKADQADTLHMFWLLMSSCDNEADSYPDAILRAQVAGWYTLWNLVAEADNEPSWVQRAKQFKETAA